MEEKGNGGIQYVAQCTRHTRSTPPPHTQPGHAARRSLHRHYHTRPLTTTSHPHPNAAPTIPTVTQTRDNTRDAGDAAAAVATAVDAPRLPPPPRPRSYLSFFSFFLSLSLFTGRERERERGGERGREIFSEGREREIWSRVENKNPLDAFCMMRPLHRETVFGCYRL